MASKVCSLVEGEKDSSGLECEKIVTQVFGRVVEDWLVHLCSGLGVDGQL